MAGTNWASMAVRPEMFRSMICWCWATVMRVKASCSSTPAQLTSTSTVTRLRLSVASRRSAAPRCARSAGSTRTVDAVPVVQGFGQRLQLGGAARHQHQIVAGFGEAVGQRLAYAGRGPGDQGAGAG